MPFQDEPRNKGQAFLGNQELSVAEISTLLNDASGHGLCNYLQTKCWHQVSSGGNLKTPFRILWYAECLGLTSSANINGNDDFKSIALRDILDCINRSNQINGKREIGMSTVLNGLNPLARQLEAAFGIKLIINRQEETIKLLSEHFTAQIFANLRKDHTNVLKKFNANLNFAKRVGVDLTKVIAGSEMEKTFAIAASCVEKGDTYYATTESAQS